jgi:hypothetical protein
MRASVLHLGLLILGLVPAATAIAAGPPNVAPPGPAMEVPPLPTAADAPQIYEHSQEAGPDETFFLVGKNLTRELFVWGGSADNPAGAAVQPHIQLSGENYLSATLPDKAFDGPLVVAAKNKAGYSPPIVLNAPQPWWCFPNQAEPGKAVRIFGRNLARRPDGQRAFVYLAGPSGAGQWIKNPFPDKYSVAFDVPADAKPGRYAVWLHAGTGGSWGWGGPVPLEVCQRAPERQVEKLLPTSPTAIQVALDALAKRGGGILELPAGTFPFTGTLRIPAGVTLRGADSRSTTLQLETSPVSSFARWNNSGWGQGPSAVHTPGDTITYDLDIPQAGHWTVWLRYATDMSPWKMPGVSGHMTLQADGQSPVPLENLPNTGNFSTFRWSKSAALDLSAGRHGLVWKNVRGGGITMDAFVLALDPGYVPSDLPLPVSGPGRIVLQAEDCVKLAARDGHLPTGDRAAVWLAGDGAGFANLTVLGNPQVNQGIAIHAADPTAWLSGCRISNVKVADCEGKQAENCGVYVHNIRNSTISDNELWGRTPLFLSGARQTEFSRNTLISVTRFGGNAEAAILGRTEPIEECVIENNTVFPPPGAQAGGPTARRLIWLSTGHGSVVHNYLASNRANSLDGNGPPQFGGVAGTDQNVGEMILFEGNHRTAYFGPLAGGDARSVTLPQTIEPTPDERLGSVRRDQLAHDAQGHETPFWPPDADDGTLEPPISEYFVTIFAGPGWGQTRRVVRREGPRLLLDRPWRVAPEQGSVVAVGTMFHQNLIVDNQVSDGMTGVQLWISCVENIVSGNSIARQRKPGLFFYGNATTLASSMPRSWNRGISPLFWNLAEGNRAEECSAGALVTSGDAANLPIDFPRALGNVLRHNSFIRSRSDGVILSSRKGTGKAPDTAASIFGTIAEFNVVRDAVTAYHAAHSCDAVVWRRNHAYFWYPVNNSLQPPVAFAVDDPKTTVASEANTIEGVNGVPSPDIIQEKKPDEQK